jgi:CubicO group peptidase (beta-lactamase class C family)
MGLKNWPQNIAKLDALIEPMLRAARIPGAAIAIVAEGKIALTRGYGLRDVEANVPLTSDTLYPIASTAKALNATLIGMLVNEGRLAWDEPVQQYLPGFRLKDPGISTQVTLRDLLAMSSYARVEDGVAYPAAMLTIGFRDARVDRTEAAPEIPIQTL